VGRKETKAAMKVFLLLAVLQLASSASLRGPSDGERGGDVELQALEDQLLAAGGDQGHHHTDADHHRDETHARSQAQTREFAEPAKSETADGTGKPVSDAPREVTLRKRPSKAYDAIHDRTKRSAQPLLPPEQVSLNCREVVAVGVKDPYTCAKLAVGSQLPGNPSTYGVSTDSAGDVLGADGRVIFADPMGDFSTGPRLNLTKAPGRCRFDPYKAGVDPSTACLCVATAATCTSNRDGCYWFEDTKTGNKECISNAERFYDHLYMLLHKRGKKDFAINIRYGATPARGSLPMGPLGPQIIGQGNPSPTYAMNPDGTASPVPATPYPVDPFYGTPFQSNPMPSPYGMMPQPGSPMPYGMMPQPGAPMPYGMMPQPGSSMPYGMMPQPGAPLPYGMMPQPGSPMPYGVMPQTGPPMPYGMMPQPGSPMPYGMMPQPGSPMPSFGMASNSANGMAQVAT